MAESSPLTTNRRSFPSAPSTVSSSPTRKPVPYTHLDVYKRQLHPNNVGRCAHVGNASYAVASSVRGLGLGRALVEDSLAQAARKGFRGLQFNAVVAGNAGAIHLYEDLGFVRVGTVPGGFVNFMGGYEDIHIYSVSYTHLDVYKRQAWGA